MVPLVLLHSLLCVCYQYMRSNPTTRVGDGGRRGCRPAGHKNTILLRSENYWLNLEKLGAGSEMGWRLRCENGKLEKRLLAPARQQKNAIFIPLIPGPAHPLVYS